MEQAEIKAVAVAPSHPGHPLSTQGGTKGHLGAGNTGPSWPRCPSCHFSNTPVRSPIPAFAFATSRTHITGSSQVPPPPEGSP